MPQAAWRLDNTPVALRQRDSLRRRDAQHRFRVVQADRRCMRRDAKRIAEHIVGIVNERGKQHNPVTGSGGMFIGSVAEIGEGLRGKIDLRAGERIASLVSLSLTPLHIEDDPTRRRRDRAASGSAAKRFCFKAASGRSCRDDIDENVALAVLDVAGAPAQVTRLCKPGQTVVVIGADGKSGMLSCAEARRQVGPEATLSASCRDPRVRVGAAASAGPFGRHVRQRRRARRAGVERTRLPRRAGSGRRLDQLRERSGNRAGVDPLARKDDGIVYFFSMSTSFTAAALGAEGVGRDVTMIIGNGYTKDHAQTRAADAARHPAHARVLQRKIR